MKPRAMLLGPLSDQDYPYQWRAYYVYLIEKHMQFELIASITTHFQIPLALRSGGVELRDRRPVWHTPYDRINPLTLPVVRSRARCLSS